MLMLAVSLGDISVRAGDWLGANLSQLGGFSTCVIADHHRLCPHIANSADDPTRPGNGSGTASYDGAGPGSHTAP